MCRIRSILAASVIISIAVFMFAGFAAAEDRINDEKKAEPRYRLRVNVSAYPIQTNPIAVKVLSDEGFTWTKLTHRGPSSGADPIIGNRNTKSYFDFKDGNEAPHYIIKQP